MKFQELPEIPQVWIDYTAGKYPGLPVLPNQYDRKFLHSHLEQVKRQASRFEKPVREAISGSALSRTPAGECIRRLWQSGSVAVVANIEAGIFGGTLSRLLKCLTAVKAAGELAGHAINAVPVCWIYTPRSEEWNPAASVRILDAKSELHRLGIVPEVSTGFSSGTALPFDQVTGLIDQIEGIGRDSFDPEILEILRASYTRNATWSSACASLVSALMGEWGLVPVDSETAGFQSIVHAACAPLLHEISGKNRSWRRNHDGPAQADDPALDCPETQPAYAVQSCILPVFAYIIDPFELVAYAEEQRAFESTGLVSPISWPASSATVMDARRRKIIEKYSISFQDILRGEEEVLHCLNERMVSSSIEAKLDSIKSVVQRHIAGLNDPGMDGKGFRKAKKQSRERIAYQFDKIVDRIAKARLEKQEVIQRQIRRACGFLAPDGIRQENSLAGISFPLRYSRSILTFLHENLDIMKFDHQLIYLQ